MSSEKQSMENYAKSQATKELVEGGQKKQEKTGSQQLQETSETKKKLKQTLLSKVLKKEWSEEEEDWIEKLVAQENSKGEKIDPMLSEEALENFWAIIEPVVSETAAGSNLNKKDVSQQGFNTMKRIVLAIMVKHDQYEIDDTNDADIIVWAFNDAIMNNLKKAEDGRLLEHHEQSEERKVFRTEGGEDSGRSWNPFSN